MKNKLIVGASLLLLTIPAFAEPLKEVVYMQCQNLKTGEVVGSIKVRRQGVAVTIMDSEKVISWEELELLKKMSEELAP